MIKQFVRIAATAALATWAVRRWLDDSRNSGQPVKVKPKAVETWEGEGGTVLPPRVAAETSAQPR